jgi:hypothetical protein
VTNNAGPAAQSKAVNRIEVTRGLKVANVWSHPEDHSPVKGRTVIGRDRSVQFCCGLCRSDFAGLHILMTGHVTSSA